MRHVYLVGFMGSGKSTVGPMLASRLNRAFYDLDDLIEKEQQMTVSELFALKGEPYFRKVESRILAQTAVLPPSVIALGGGTYCSEANRTLVAENGISVWLKIPMSLAEERCYGTSTRPLAKDPEKFQALFRFRDTQYALSQIRVDVEDKRPWQIADEILERLSDPKLRGPHP